MMDEATFRAMTSDLRVSMWEDVGEYVWKLDLPWHLPNFETIKEDPHEFDWKALENKALGDRQD